MNYKIIRSKRRTISLLISPDATLTVRAPFMATLEYIKKLVAKKRSWINKKQMQMLKFINSGDSFYLGEVHKLKFGSRTDAIEWYRRQAFPKITERARFYSQKTGWKFKSISITKAESRWGSCGPQGSINFSWRLVMAPPDVVDYVIVHELAHIPERNHSAGFWNKVKSVLPDYKERRKWLRENVAKFKV